jgi:DNA-binding LytR/AlgR family response regulator
MGDKILNVLIVEDEPLAAAQLAAHLAVLRANAKILAVCDTVRATVGWLKQNPLPDLIFLDIQLGDGLSFDIFEEITLDCPVIFTTAYDQYALKAFKVNSIDYLLKPIDRAELEAALQKFEKGRASGAANIPSDIIEKLIASVNPDKFKKRFLVKVGTHIRMVDVTNILYFYSFQKGTFIKSRDGKNYLIEQSLEVVEDYIDPAIFFRINRKYIVAVSAIKDVISYSNSRLKLKIDQGEDDDFLVAREKVKDFKNWLGGE